MALPIDFITRTRALLGEEFDRLEAALSADVPVSIRINPMKGTSAPKAGAPVAWCESGFYLPERLSFTFDPLFHAGAYYVQERAGTLPGFMRRPGWQVHASGELIAGWKPVSEQ